MSKSDPGARERSAGTQRSCEASYSRFIYAFLENWTTIAHIHCIYFGAKISSFRLGQSSVLETMEDVEKVFTELICTLEKKRSEIKEQIGAQEKTEIDRAEEHHKHLDQELTELRKRQTKIKKLLSTDDQIHCLKVMKVISRAVLVNLTTVPCLSGIPKHLFYLYLNRVNPRLLGALCNFHPGGRGGGGRLDITNVFVHVSLSRIALAESARETVSLPWLRD